MAARPADTPTGAGVGLPEVGREWGRIGCIGFGGPPAHISLLRELCVTRHQWLSEGEFEDAIAACNLLPGPASTQLAILCAWRVAGPVGALVGGIAFIVPGLALILALAVVFLASAPPLWVGGAGAGAGAAVAAVAVRAGVGLLPASWRGSPLHARWLAYVLVGGVAAATLGALLVVVLLAGGLLEVLWQGRVRQGGRLALHVWPLLATVSVATGGTLALVWVALKVGALSYGGGFVIVPLMQADAVSHYHWMTSVQFVNGVALGQITPGPVLLTIAFVGYAAGGIGGGLLAAAVAFAPSFAFVLLGARHFSRLRANPQVQSFLDGAGPAAIGAIIGAAVPLALALHTGWQFGVLSGAAVALLLLRRSVVPVLLTAGLIGAIVGATGAPL